jgi:hypothetical protein
MPPPGFLRPSGRPAKEGSLADKSTQLLLDALSRAVAEPSGLPLYGTRAAPGLFPSTPPGKQAAQRCKEEGWLRVVDTQTRGKTVCERCTLTEKGLAFLLSQVSPRHVLEDFVRALEARQGQVHELLAMAQQTQASVASLQTAAEKVLGQIDAAPPGQPGLPAAANPWTGAALEHLARWQKTRTSEDCPLPDLYHHAEQASPGLSIGRFHDGLRQLHDEGHIYLHPWTGPLYEIPQPPYALLVGHEIAYYASRRCA